MPEAAQSEDENYKSWRSYFNQRTHFILDNLVAECAQQRGLDFIFPIILSGNGFGPYYEDTQKNIFLDLNGSIGVQILGCAHPVFLKALQSSAQNGFVMQTHLFPGKEYVELVGRLSELAMEQLTLDCCWLAPSGSAALDAGVQIGLARQKPGKKKILSFHKTYFADSKPGHLTGSKDMPNENLTLLTFPTKGNSQHVDQCRREIEALIPRLDSEFGAFVFEPFLCEGGFRSLDYAVMENLLQNLRKYGVSIITDETQTFMRSPSPFATHFVGFSNYVDIAIVGKALQGAAVLFKKSFVPPRGILRGTFAGSTVALSGGLALLEFMISEDFFGAGGKIAKINSSFVTGLEKISSRSETFKIFDIDSCGLMVAFSIDSGKAYAPMMFVRALFKAGMLASLCGADQSRVRFHLPAIIRTEEINLALRIIEESLRNL